MIFSSKKEFSQFNNDVITNRGYLYTTNAPKSSLVANTRQTEITKFTVGKIKNLKVIDVGCGDGTYSNEIFCWGRPKLMVGVDVSKEGIILARRRFLRKRKNLVFKHASCYQIPYPQKFFNLAIARGLLHHLDHPLEALSEIVRVAKKVFIIEPNGYNPFLKVIEIISPYHQAHHEKSYAPLIIRSWAGRLGRKVIKDGYVGLVPFFCPDWIAIFLKKLEPIIERIPWLRNCLCAVYIIYLAEEESEED